MKFRSSLISIRSRTVGAVCQIVHDFFEVSEPSCLLARIIETNPFLAIALKGTVFKDTVYIHDTHPNYNSPTLSLPVLMYMFGKAQFLLESIIIHIIFKIGAGVYLHNC